MPKLTVDVSDVEYQYLRSYYHLYTAERLSPDNVEKQSFTAPYDFIPTDIEARLVVELAFKAAVLADPGVHKPDA